jgi:hypothetical protein
MELTKEYFDERLNNLHDRMDSFTERMDHVATKHDLDTVSSALDTRLKEQAKEMKAYVHEAFEHQQFYIDARVDEIINMLDVRLAVQTLQAEMNKVKAAIHMD